ncbi:MAG: DNA-3-methyladenine glycosylase [Bdellovibrio sp.]|nr:MAG: DNA-3-methyladenine glycosylase [Bdellovibrio sp.]
MGRVLPMSFYRRRTVQVAQELLGHVLIHELRPGHCVAGRIVETEAYLGNEDPACHSYNNRRTERTEVMYRAGGFSYVYFIYGMYFCFNVVTEKKDKAEAVLIRALEPLEGIDKMKKLRRTQNEKILCAGPGRLCQALGIDRGLNGLPLHQPPLWIEEGIAAPQIVAGERIGIAQPEARSWPLRFCLKDSPYVSRRVWGPA